MKRSLYCMFLFVLLLVGEAQAQRSFAKRVGFNIRGEVVMIGNTNMYSDRRRGSIPSGVPSNGNTSTSSLAINDYYYMRHVDVDGNGTTFNSSSADLSLPVVADSVLWAGLYWQSYSAPGYSQYGLSANSNANKYKVRFRKAGNAYTEYTATQQDQITTSYYSSTVSGGNTYDWRAYQGYFDVTAVIRAGGSGTYQAANIVCPYDAYGVGAGWALVVLYKKFDGNVTKNMVVFDGYSVVQPNSSTDISLSGFKTPNSSPVYSEIGAVAFEGDLGLTGDQMGLLVPGSPPSYNYIGDGQNPSTNFFNSSISAFGSRVTAKYPDFPNQLGYDADLISTTGMLPVNTTSTTVHLTTSGDLYFPGVVTFETEIFGPAIQTEKLFYDATTDTYSATRIVPIPPYDIPHRTVQYHFNIENTGVESALATRLIDTIPMYQDYIAGSMEISMNGTTWTTLTDASDGDEGYYDATWKRVIIGIGNNATSSAGGQLLQASVRHARFKTLIQDPATFSPPPPNLYEIPNFAKVFYTDTAAYAFEANSTGVLLSIDNALPVELASFIAHAVDGDVMLKWNTLTETNNFGFDIERNTGGGDWSTLAFVPGNGTSNAPKSYQFRDVHASSLGDILRYRLKVIDRDGAIEYSNEVEVTFGNSAFFGLSPAYPNPVAAGAASAVRFTVATTGQARVSVSDIFGKTVAVIADGLLPSGNYSATFFTRDLPAGVYLIDFASGGQRFSQKVLVSR